MITLPSGRKIGEGQPPFVIAEVGSNWQTLEHCLHSISMAKACGADAVKFQAFDAHALYGVGHYGVPTSTEGVLDLTWLPSLKAKADACGIEFMCSAFSPELVDAVNPYVNIHKVASAEMTHVRILERLAAIGKPVILSTGASGEKDIERALEVLKGVPVVLMYCVAAYPARRIELEKMLALKKFGAPVGYSDHSIDVQTIPGLAATLGACVIEKHVNFEGVDGPDAPHALSTDDFKHMVTMLKWTHEQMPNPPACPPCDHVPIVPGPEERPMILRHNRRLIATRDVAVGEALEEGKNFGIYRSLKDDTHALSPFKIAKVHGQVAKRAIKAGDGIGPSDF